MEDNNVIEFSAPPIDKVDASNTREVVSTIASSVQSIHSIREQEALKIFRLGVLLLRADDSKADNNMPSMRELGNYTGISYAKLSIAKTVVKKLGSDESEFLKQYRDSNATSWTSFAKKICKEKRKYRYRSLGSNVGKKIDEFIQRLGNGDATEEQIEEILHLRRRINKHLPLKRDLVEAEDIKYSMCACCGDEDIPPEGWTMKKDSKYYYMTYPICPNCEELNLEPSYEIIAKIYALHSYRMEEFYSEMSEIYGD